MSSEKTDHSEIRKSKLDWLPIVLSTVLTLGLIIFIFKGCNGSDDSEATTTSIGSETDSVVKVSEMATRESVKVKLADLNRLSVRKDMVHNMRQLRPAPQMKIGKKTGELQ